MHCGARQCQWDSQCKRQVPRSPSQAEQFLRIHLYQYPILSVFRAMPNASMEQERKKSFANFGVFIALLANAASSLVTMATALGSTTISYGQAMNGLVLRCLPHGDCWEVVCWAAVIFQRGFELSRRQNQGTQWPCFLNVPGCRNLQEFVGYGGDGGRGRLGYVLVLAQSK